MRSRQPRIVVLGGLVLSLVSLLLGRLGQVQVLQQTELHQVARQTATRTVVEPAVRGRILDSRGEALTTNTATLSVTIERSALADAKDAGRAEIERVAAVLRLAPEPLWDRTFLCGTVGAKPPPACFNGSPYQPIPVADRVDPQRALSLSEQPESYPGVGVVTVPARAFPAPGGVNAAHLLGYVDRANAADIAAAGGAVTETETVGRAGLEAQYDSVLRGSHGTTTVGVDPRGIVTARLASTPPVPGRDVVTHLSGPVQAATERALAEAVASARRGGYAADSGAAVVLDVTNGAVVAAASYPAYDPNVWNGGISQADLDRLSGPTAGTPLVSRVTSAAMPPASTFKVVSVPAVASTGVDLTGTYDCPASVQVGNRRFGNYESRAFGQLTLRRNIEVSCDTIWYQFAYRAWLAQGGLTARDDSADPFVSAARAFGLGSRTGVDLPSEVAGRIPDREWKRQTWEATRAEVCNRAGSGYPEVAATDPARAGYLTSLAVENCQTGFQFRAGDAANFAIGQGDIAVTPLQLATVYAAIANGGTRWVPQVAAAFRNPDGTGTEPIAPKAAGTAPLRPDVLAFLRDALRGVVTEGTAAGAFAGWPQDAYPVAGKTGSAEVFGKQATSWFASYAPATAPRYAVVVMVAQAGTGAGTAAPAARRIYEALRAQG